MTTTGLTELQEAVIYKMGRKISWSKTGQITLPLFMRMTGLDGRRMKALLKELTSLDIVFVQKRQREKVVRFTSSGFEVGLKIRDLYEEQVQ